ncbi:hypothetical protein C1H46_024185 [Malus baccata]|uniref:F-box domain-containing protein n=1 Tax=Malus baccata TaxID=106549 RepID=A0A540LV41_MALBA|nr:hypothetical protein C1H46_024185 [Malus baccata]
MGSTSKCQEGVDRISELPNSLLCHILSFLPILDAAQTTILSRRWENLWTPLPKLVFDDDCFPYSWIESNMIVFLIHGLNPIASCLPTFENLIQLELNFNGRKIKDTVIQRLMPLIIHWTTNGMRNMSINGM